MCYEALANLGWWLCPGAVCPYLVDGQCHIVQPIDRLTFGLILQRSVHLHKQWIPSSPFSLSQTLQRGYRSPGFEYCIYANRTGDPIQR